MTEMLGKTIAQYRIIEEVGRGGMGVVYKAEDTKLDRIVALKFLPQDLVANETERARFFQEAKAASALNHPNVCVIHDIQEHDRQLFIVMEYVDGRTLRAVISDLASKGEQLPVEKIVDWALQIGDALTAAHEKGIVHRDIKADNIMVNAKKQIKVMDFGLAKLKGSLKLTRTSSTVGTLAYMSPEQIQGGEVDARSDIFSLGVVLYEMLAGQTPFRGEHEAAVMYSILNEEPQAVEKYRPGLSPELLHVLNRALEKDIEDRYQSVHEMVIDIRRLKKESTKISRKSLEELSTPPPVTGVSESREAAPVAVTAEMPGAARKKKGRPLTLAGIILAFALLGALGYFLFTEQSETGERIPIAVADIINQTKEEELDGLSGMLITSLEQSRRLAVLTRSRMFDILKQMGKTDVDRIDEALGREICGRANVNALVLASIRKFDQLYTLDLKILDPLRNEYLFTAKEEGEGKASIPSMIDRLSDKTRIGLKEKVAEIQAAKRKVAEVTTTNLEAYQHYFLGEQLINKLQFMDAAKEFQNAVALDTTFALAYYRLAYALAWYANPGADEAIQKAMLLIDKVPEKERYLIRGEHAIIQKDLQKGLSIFNELLRLYPNEKEALYLMGDYSYHQQDYPTAITHLEKVLVMDPTFERAYQHLSWTYSATQQFDKKLEVTKQYVVQVPDEHSFSLLADAFINQAKFDSALQTYRRAHELFPKSMMPLVGIGQTYIFLNKFAEAETDFSKMIEDSQPPVNKRVGYRNLAWLSAYRGKCRQTIMMHDNIIELDLKEADKSDLAKTYAEKAFWLAYVLKDTEKAKKALEHARENLEAGDIELYTALFNAYLALGEHDEARSIGKARLAIVFPGYNSVVDAGINMKSGKFEAAISNLQSVRLSVGTGDEQGIFDLARCYFETSRFEKAIAELQRVENSRGNYFKRDNIDFRAAVYPKTLFLLGKTYEKTGDTKSAVANYQKLLKLWEHADKDLPELIAAKARVAELRKMATR